MLFILMSISFFVYVYSVVRSCRFNFIGNLMHFIVYLTILCRMLFVKQNKTISLLCVCVCVFLVVCFIACQPFAFNCNRKMNSCVFEIPYLLTFWFDHRLLTKHSQFARKKKKKISNEAFLSMSFKEKSAEI